MSITNYIELQSAVAEWLNRTDLTDRVPTFIHLAESRLKRLLRLRMNETEAHLTSTIGSQYITLPEDYGVPVALWLEAWIPRTELIYRNPEQIGYIPIANYPQYWTIDGSRLAFNCPANNVYPFTFRYGKKNTLSSVNSTNWLLTEFPDVYLYGALTAAAPFLMEDGRLAMWKTLFEESMQEVQEHENRNKTRMTLGTEFPQLQRRHAFNIYRG